MTPLLCRLHLHRWRHHPAKRSKGTRDTWGPGIYYPYIACKRCGKAAA